MKQFQNFSQNYEVTPLRNNVNFAQSCSRGFFLLKVMLHETIRNDNF